MLCDALKYCAVRRMTSSDGQFPTVGSNLTLSNIKWGMHFLLTERVSLSSFASETSVFSVKVTRSSSYCQYIYLFEDSSVHPNCNLSTKKKNEKMYSYPPKQVWIKNPLLWKIPSKTFPNFWLCRILTLGYFELFKSVLAWCVVETKHFSMRIWVRNK